MLEHFFTCPYCWEQISMLVDISQTEQQYVEDCEVCCNPIELNISTDGENLVGFEAHSLEQ